MITSSTQKNYTSTHPFVSDPLFSNYSVSVPENITTISQNVNHPIITSSLRRVYNVYHPLATNSKPKYNTYSVLPNNSNSLRAIYSTNSNNSSGFINPTQGRYVYKPRMYKAKSLAH